MKYIGKDGYGNIYDTKEKIKDYIKSATSLMKAREYFDNGGDYALSMEAENAYGEYRVADEDMSIATWMEYFEKYVNEMYERGEWGLTKCRVFKKMTISNAKATIIKIGPSSVIRLDDVEDSIDLIVEDVFLTEEEVESCGKCQGTLDIRGNFTGSALINEEVFIESLKETDLKNIFSHAYFVEDNLLYRVAFASWKNRKTKEEEE